MESYVVIPEVTRKRMVQLLQILKAWPDAKITSVAISNSTGWKDSLIRHDLWLLGYNKGVSNGYLVQDLIKALELALGIEIQTVRTVPKVEVKDRPQSLEGKNCCIVGLGRLGAALLDDETTEGSSFKIKAGFDANVYRVEILRSTFPLYPASEMNWIIKQEKIEYAILTVATKDAQKMCDRLVQAGIKGIVNMTNTVLRVPDGIRVENLSILNALNLVI